MNNVQLAGDWTGSLVEKLPFLWGKKDKRIVISKGIRNAGFFILFSVPPLILILVCVY